MCLLSRFRSIALINKKALIRGLKSWIALFAMKMRGILFICLADTMLPACVVARTSRSVPFVKW